MQSKSLMCFDVVYMMLGWIVAVSRHYYHYICICARSRNSCWIWLRSNVAEPGVVLVCWSNLAVTWWLLAEFSAEVNICDNPRPHWPLPPPPRPCTLFLCFGFPSVFSYMFSSIPLCLPGLPRSGCEEWLRKSGTLMPIDHFLLPAPISIIATSAAPKVVRSSEHLAPTPCFQRSVGSICL